MKSYRDLDAYNVAMEFVEEMYRLTASFPPDERYGLTAQLRRAVCSIVANIAEGFGRFSYADKANKYTIARGECYEAEAGLHVAIRLRFLSSQHAVGILNLGDRLGKILSRLIQSSRRHAHSSM